METKVCRLVIMLMPAWLVISISSVTAQPSDWNVNPAAYQYTMSAVVFLSVDHNTLVAENDRVAAFAGGEVRGVASPIYVASAGRHLAYLTIFGNTPDEEIAFKIYQSAREEVRDASVTLSFKIDGQVGNVFQAFSIANPRLSSEAEIKEFSFDSLLPVSSEIGDGQINIVLTKDQERNNLTPKFVISDGARMFVDRTMVESGNTVTDFSETVTYSVLSEDESVLRFWMVNVTQAQGNETGFFSTNVITPNNDGLNDYWIVQDVFKYDQAEFKIFDANGRILFESTGYRNDWNGLYKGVRLSRGKYYFVIRDPATNTVIKGDILIVY